MKNEIDFYSKKTRCSALYYKTNLKKPNGIIVMAHGLGGVKELWIDKFASFFAKNGYECFLFDYRNHGTSDGNKRQLVNVKDQLIDWNNAIDFVKNNLNQNNKNIILFGSSFSGGHVIKLLSERKDIKMAISQCPYTDTLATVKTFSLFSMIKLMLSAILDLLTCVTGYHPYTLLLANESGKKALMKVANYDAYEKRIPKNLKVINKAPARTVFEFLKYSPGKYFKKIDKPIFVSPCLKDNLAPAYKTIELAKKCKSATIKEYNCHHFDIYFDDLFEESSKDYLKFLNKYTINSKNN